MNLPLSTQSWTATIAKLSDENFAEFDDGSRLPLKTALPTLSKVGLVVKITTEVYEKHTSVEWARAYAVQAKSDIAIYEILKAHRGTAENGDCHELHYFQMALEKSAKAYLIEGNRNNIAKYKMSHDVVGEFKNKYIKSPEAIGKYRNKKDLLNKVMNLAVSIGCLVPAVDRILENVEYPWSNQNILNVPANMSFRKKINFESFVWTELEKIVAEVADSKSC